MIGYKKKSIKAKERKYQKTFGFALGKGDTDKMLVSKSSLNCDCRGGKLKTGIGFSPYLRNNAAISYKNENVREIYPVKVLSSDGTSYTEILLVMDESGYLSYYDTSTSTFKMKTICGENSHFFGIIGTDKKMTVALATWGRMDLLSESLVNKSTGLKGTGAACFFKHRLFCGVRPNLLYYSAPNDFSNFNESIDDGGWVNLGENYGESVAMCVFKDMLYVFFEYAIVRIRAVGSARDFAPQRLPYSGEKIFGRTVGVCGNAIFFLAKDGVYRFDGNVAERLETGIRISETYARKKFGCAAYNGKMCIRYYDEQDVGRTIVIYEDGKSWYFKEEIKGLSQAGARAMGMDGFLIKYLDDEGALPIDKSYYFYDCETDFGLSGTKTLTKLRFNGKGMFELTLRNGLKTFKKILKLTNGVVEVDFLERGEVFGIDIRLYQGARLDSITAEYRALK